MHNFFCVSSICELQHRTKQCKFNVKPVMLNGLQSPSPKLLTLGLVSEKLTDWARFNVPPNTL